MTAAKLAPDDIILTHLLEGCRHAGNHSLGKRLFEEMLAAQQGSWGRRVDGRSFIIAGGSRDTGPEVICEEGNFPRDRICKEATLLYRAAVRAEQEGYEWLLGLHEDSFVRLDLVEQLKEVDPDDPVVFSYFGCGQNWTYHAESRNGTVPIPDDWREPPRSCDAVERLGGMCSAASFVVSRGALLKIKGDRTLKQFVQFVADLGDKSDQTDIATSCLMHHFNIPMMTHGGHPGVIDTAEINKVNFNGNYTYEEIKAHMISKGHIGYTNVHVNVPKEHGADTMRYLDRLFHDERFDPQVMD
jgi:hypothetical protein